MKTQIIRSRDLAFCMSNRRITSPQSPKHGLHWTLFGTEVVAYANYTIGALIYGSGLAVISLCQRDRLWVVNKRPILWVIQKDDGSGGSPHTRWVQ